MKKRKPDDKDYSPLIILILFVLFVVCSCSKEHPVNIEREGYMNYNISVPLNRASKTDVPECMDTQPTYLKVRLLNSFNLAHIDTVPVILNNNMYTHTEPLVFPVNNYQADEISLLDSNYEVLYTVPESGSEFAYFLDKTLPYPVNITPQNTTYDAFTVVCYTDREVILDSDATFDITAVKLEELSFYVPPGYCIDQVSIQINNSEPRFFDIDRSGIYDNIYIPDIDVFYRINTYINGILYQAVAGQDYDQSTITLLPGC